MGDTMRDGFEAFCSDRWGGDRGALTWDETRGEYHLCNVNYAWLAWQAAHEAGRQLGMEQERALWEMAKAALESGMYDDALCHQAPKAELAKTSEAVPLTEIQERAAFASYAARNTSLHPNYDAAAYGAMQAGWLARAKVNATATPQPAAEREPLSELRINQIAAANEVFQYHPGAILEFVRDIEAAHGIGQQAKEQT